MTRSRRFSAARQSGPTAVEVCADFEPHRLVRARQMCGWTRRDLADAASVTPQQIMRWEANVGVPKAYELEKIAEATGHLVGFFKRGRPMAILDSSALFMCNIDR